MNLENYYWVFENALSKSFCDKIISIGQTKLPISGTIQDTANEKKDINKKQRNSDISFIDDQFIFDELGPYINTANKNANWNFQFDWYETCQFTSYKPKQFYDWHCDAFRTAYKSDNLNFNNKIRKLSCTLLLNSVDDFEGGDFEIDYRNKKSGSNIFKVEGLKKPGSLLVFPSHVWHRVKPVTKGIRYSLVIWVLGKSFL